MSAVDRKSLQLLKEIHNICKENGIKYSLGLKSIIALEHEMETINYDVIMSTADMLKFIDIFEKNPKEDRALEHMKSSKNYLGFEVCYVNTATTAINLHKGKDYKYHGIKVVIRPMRYCGEKKKFIDKVSGVLETGWNCNGYRFTRKFKKKRLMAVGIVRFLMIFGKERLAKFIFNLCAKTSMKGEKVYTKSPGKKRLYLEQDYLEHVQLVKYGKNKFYVFKDRKKFLEKKYGINWEERVDGILSYTDFLIVADKKYEDVLADMERNHIDINDYFSEQRKNLFRAAFVIRSFRYRNKAILIARRSGDRLHFYEEFESMRDEIMDLYAREDFDQLQEIFAEHERKTLFYLKRGLGFCVNREYFEIQKALFERQEKFRVIRKLERLIPEEHYDSII